MAAADEDLAHRLHPQPGHAQQLFLGGAIDIDRELFAKLERPGELGIDVERQVAVGLGRLHHFDRLVAVEPHQPVGLVKPVFADQRRAFQRQHRAGIGDRREGAVIDAAQAEIVIQPARLADDVRIGRGIGPDDHLRRLARGGEARRVLEALSGVFQFAYVALDPAHRAFDLPRILVRREPGEPAVGRQFDIDRYTVGIKPRLVDDLGIGLGNGLEMDVAAKIVFFPQDTGDFHKLFHRVVRVLHDARGQEQPLDIIAPVEGQREVDDFLRREPRPRDIRTLAVDAVMAVEHAVIGQQDLEQRDTAAIGCVGVTDAHPLGRTDSLTAHAGAFGRARGRAGSVVFCRVGENLELLKDGLGSHSFYICSTQHIANVE